MAFGDFTGWGMGLANFNSPTIFNNQPLSGPGGDNNGRWGRDPVTNTEVWIPNASAAAPSPQASVSGNLASLLSGAGAPVAPIKLEQPKVNLQDYTGNTNVQMSPETQQMLQMILQYGVGPLQQLLSGQTNQGLFEAGVVAPAQRNFNNVVLPGINEQYSGGAYGGNFWGGARLQAGQEAQNKLNENISGLRYQDYNNAQNRSLQAGQLLPAMAQALSLKEQLATQNLDRGINVHYQNQGLHQQAYQDDMSFIQALLSQNQQQIGQAGDIRGNLLSLLQQALSREQGIMSNDTTRSGNSLQAGTSRYNAGLQANTQLSIAQIEAQAKAEERAAELQLIREQQAQNAGKSTGYANKSNLIKYLLGN